MNKKERIERLDIELERVKRRLSYIEGAKCLDIELVGTFYPIAIKSRTLESVLENTDKAISVLDKTTVSHEALTKENTQLYEMLDALCEHLGVEIVRTAPEPAQFVVEEM